MAWEIMFLSAAAVEQQHLAGVPTPGEEKAGRRQHQLEILTFYRQGTLCRSPKRVIAIQRQREEAMTAPVWRTRRDVSFPRWWEITMIALSHKMSLRVKHVVVIEIANAPTGNSSKESRIVGRDLEEMSHRKRSESRKPIDNRASP